MSDFNNPFRPGAGQAPPFLAGRQHEQDEFRLLLKQNPILKNLVLTGLRGVGKTVLLDALKPIAISEGWLWAGTDLNESTSISDYKLSTRILADLSSVVSPFSIEEKEINSLGFNSQKEKIEIKLSYDTLRKIYDSTPGLDADKLKNILRIIWSATKNHVKGIVLAYDEAQNLKDHASDKEYPLSLLLEIIQFVQKHQIPYLLILTGLPTLPSNLVDARTYSERMFHIITLEKLTPEQSREAIIKPIEEENCPVSFNEIAIQDIIKYSGGYPYFIQFLCKEAYDLYLQQKTSGINKPLVTMGEVIRKLDMDFYSLRWNKVTDRQRDLLAIIAQLPEANEEFSIQNIISKSKETKTNPFSPSQTNQLLVKLSDMGLIYKNGHGRYSFAVPMLADYINRQIKTNNHADRRG